MDSLIHVLGFGTGCILLGVALTVWLLGAVARRSATSAGFDDRSDYYLASLLSSIALAGALYFFLKLLLPY